MPKRSDFRVLSIQSHVVSGYVGNKSACFPLQVLGFEVDTINSVQLSNHTGYKHWKGQVLNSSDLEDLFMGLKLNGLHHYTHLLTGYVGTTSFLEKIIEVVKELKEVNPELYFVCDPVMGDNGKMYVPEDLLPVYRDQLIPMANLITPNQFEAELLTGVSIKTEDDVTEAMNILHNKGVETVVVSSANLGTANTLTVMGSSVQGDEKTSVRLEIPYLPATFLGTGDLFAAVLLAWMAKSCGDLKSSCEKAINTVHSVLKRTLEYAEDCRRTGEDIAPDMLELKIIQSKEDIENPKAVFSSASSRNMWNSM